MWVCSDPADEMFGVEQGMFAGDTSMVGRREALNRNLAAKEQFNYQDFKEHLRENTIYGKAKREIFSTISE